MATQDVTRPVFLPVIIGTPRQGRLTEPAASFVFGEVSKRSDIESELIDIRKIPLRIDDAGEALKNSQFSATVARADGLILVVPEYNHSFPGLLKHVLDTNLKEYIHKAVGVCGVSAGPFGGARMIQSLVPVLRELGLVTIFSDFVADFSVCFTWRLSRNGSGASITWTSSRPAQAWSMKC
jgi:NAD(P)H-dependent FMN reductase